MDVSFPQNFGDLNSFIDSQIWELHDYEMLFHNQMMALTELLQQMVCNRSKVQFLRNRVNVLTCTQSDVDSMLEYVEGSQKKWEEFLNKFEEKYSQDMNAAPTDCWRSALYAKADKIFTDLKNSDEVVSNIQYTTEECSDIAVKQEPYYTLFKVIDNNLCLLERLFVYIENLRGSVDKNEELRRKMLQ